MWVIIPLLSETDGQAQQPAATMSFAQCFDTACCVSHTRVRSGKAGEKKVNSVTTKENKKKKVLQPHKLRENTVSLYYRIKFLCIISFRNISLTSVTLSRPSSLLLLKNAFIFFYLSLISHMDSLLDVSLKCLQTMKMSGAIFIFFFFFFFL